MLGKIVEVHRYPLTDYFEIQTNTKTFLLPYTPSYIINVDIKKKIIEVQGAIFILDAS
jgi:16S rRNA processing protein RimM